jgi:hypothetical protein
LPRYFFHVRVPGEADHEDPEGTVFVRDSDALDYANRIMGKLKNAGGYAAPGIMMIVKDHTKRIVFSLPF